jgi:histidinol phosphatase-like enzyme (inositol monophosphatase family)
MSDLNTDTLVAFAEDLADAAGPIVAKYFRTGLAVDRKADNSPVTAGDRAVETRLREMIEARFPDHGIAGEEYGVVRGDARYVWSLDPIDGTKSFISGRPLFGTLIGLLEHGEPILGVVDCSAIGERWIGGRDVTPSFNGVPCRSRTGVTLAEATLAATSPEMFETEAEMAAFARLKDRARLTLYAGDCHNYGLLASGHLDLVVEAGLQDYDYLGPSAVIEAAGGVVTDWEGKPVRRDSTSKILAAGSKALHDEALAVLNGG